MITPVTVESFMAWKQKFDAEMFEAKKKEIIQSAEIAARMSGRQYFEKNKNMKVDELEDDDEEDEDWDENEMNEEDEEELE